MLEDLWIYIQLPFVVAGSLAAMLFNGAMLFRPTAFLLNLAAAVPAALLLAVKKKGPARAMAKARAVVFEEGDCIDSMCAEKEYRFSFLRMCLQAPWGVVWDTFSTWGMQFSCSGYSPNSGTAGTMSDSKRYVIIKHALNAYSIVCLWRTSHRDTMYLGENETYRSAAPVQSIPAGQRLSF